MASETPEQTQNDTSAARSAELHSASQALQDKLASDAVPATPLAQLVMAIGTVVIIGAGAMLSRVTLVPPPPATRIQALTAARAAPPQRLPAPAVPAAEPVAAPAAAAEAVPVAPPPPPAKPAAVPEPVEPPAARRVETAPKSHGKKPRRAPTSTRKRASTRPADSAAPAATRRRPAS
jgi:hypothetical protein